MVLLYSPSPASNSKNKKRQAEILSLDYQGLGVAKIEGKTWFIENALPQELVQIQSLEEKRQYGIGVAQKILRANPLRQLPFCQYYGDCGGCQSQHIPLNMQRECKQNALFERLAKLQKQAIEYMPMIVGEQWHYRRRIRLSLFFNTKTKQLEMGFRQKNSQQIVSIQQCPVLEPILNALLLPLQQLLDSWSNPKDLGHIELVAADNGVAMLLRHRKQLEKNCQNLLLEFAQKHNLMLFVQDDQKLMHWHGEKPFYQLDSGLKLFFDIRDFIQVNRVLNEKMVETALNWLDLQAQDHVLDLFCGMGNFTLPISRQVALTIGIEGVEAMVEKARTNAQINNCNNVEFHAADLEQDFRQQTWTKHQFNKILLDPPRAGAAFALNTICQLQAEKILYVSCNPATLVRDAEFLLKSGYFLHKIAMIDMFPNTGHLESISLFSKK